MVVMGPAVAEFKERGWLQSDGSCKYYNRKTRRCSIYEERPDCCRVDRVRPKGIGDIEWSAKMDKYCDVAHEIVYQRKRERGIECPHRSKGMLELQIETTSTCNAACGFCVYPVAGRRGGLMAMDLFKKIIDEAATIPEIGSFVLHGLGEPTLDNCLASRISYIAQKVPHANIEIFTNGLGMTPEKFDSLKDAGITCIVFSLNAVNQWQHETIMGLRGKFDRVCSNIDYAIANKGNVHIEVRAVSNNDTFTREDVIRFYHRWGHREAGGYGQCILEMNWSGDNRTIKDREFTEGCGRALTQMYITYDGKVTMCCLDPTGKTIFGDLTRQTLRDVYNGEDYLNFRVAHAENRWAQYEQCKGCTRA